MPARAGSRNNTKKDTGRGAAAKRRPARRSGVGAAIQSAGKPLAPPKPARSVGKTIQRTGRPIAKPKARPRPKRGPSKTGKAISRAGRPMSTGQEKEALYNALAVVAESTKRAKAQPPRPSTLSSVGRAIGTSILGNSPTSPTNRSGPLQRDAARKAAPKARRDARKAITEELEGKGDIAKYSRRLGKYATTKGMGVQTGGGPAGIAAKRSKKGGAARLAAARPYRVKDTPKVFRKGLEDFINFPSTAIPSAYVPVSAGVQAARGNTKPAKEYWKGIQESDPVYAAGEAVAKAASGDSKGAKKSLRRARDLAAEHPGFTAMEVYGLGRGLDRGAGAGVRATGRVTLAAGRKTGSKSMQDRGRRIYEKADPNNRPEATVPRTAMRHDRVYDRGLLGKKAGVIRDRKGAERAARKRLEADRAEQAGDPGRARKLREDAAKGGPMNILRDPKRMTDSEIKRYVNLQQASGESRRVRFVTDARQKAEDVVGYSATGAKARNAAAKARRKPQTARVREDDGAALNLIAQNITRADPSDLKAYRSELARAFDKLTDPDKRAANKAVRDLIDKSLEAERKNPGTLKRNAERAREYSREVDQPLDRLLREVEMIDGDQAARVKVQAYAARRLGARMDDEHYIDRRTGARLTPDEARAKMRDLPSGEGRQRYSRVQERWVNREGKPLDYEAVARQMAAEPDAVMPSFISQSPNATSLGSYFRSSEKEPTLGSKPRTEKATLEGTFDASTEPMVARATRAANLYAGAKNYRDGVRDAAFRVNDKVEWNDRPTANQIAKRATQETGTEFVVVRAKPWGVTRKQFESMLDDIDDLQNPAGFDSFRKDILDGLNGNGEGPYVVVPRTWRDQQVAHTNVLGSGDAAKLWQAFRAGFSKAVLSTSPSPTIGNAVEGYGFRMPLRRAGPISITTYHRMMKRLRENDPEVANLIEDMTMGGPRGSSGALTVQTRSRHFNPDQLSRGGWQTTSRAFNALVHHTPPGKLASGAYQLWTAFVFDLLNTKLIERPVQKALLGKELRQSGLMDADLFNVSGKAMDQLADGVRDMPTLVKFANGLRDSYGQYRAFGPTNRKIIQNAAPFLAWWLSSANFLIRVMPRDHPVVLALTAQAAQVTDDLEREQERWNSKAKWLRGTLDVGGVRWQATRNTPLGAFTDPTGTSGSLVLPQIQTIVQAMQGRDWKGKDLKHKDGRPYDPIDIGAYVIGQLVRSSTGAALPLQAWKYSHDPAALLNAVRVKPSKDGSRYDQTPKVKQRKSASSSVTVRPDPEVEALRREAQSAAKSQGGYSQREIDALRREAEALARMGR